MIGKYDDIYRARVSKWGNTYQERVKNQREVLFEKYLASSVYQVSFYDLEDSPVLGILQPYKQDDTKTVQCLLVKNGNEYSNGTIFEIDNVKWMILRKDPDIARGYLKYYVLKMTHTITIYPPGGEPFTTPGYFYGPMSIHIKDLLESRAKEPVYLESNKTNHLVIPYTDKIVKESYFKVNHGNYIITGFDQDSTLGVCYISANSTYEHDLTPPPTQSKDDNPDDFFWLGGDYDG